MGERGVPLLAEATKNEKTVMWALLALENIGPKAHEAQDAVIALLKEKDSVLREQAALTLSRIAPDPQKSIPALLPLLDDVVPVRAAAALAISQFGSKANSAAGKFQKMLEDKDEFSRLVGARGLIAVARPHGAAQAGIENSLRWIGRRTAGHSARSGRGFGIVGNRCSHCGRSSHQGDPGQN